MQHRSPADQTTCASGFPPPAIALAGASQLAGEDFIGEQKELYLSEERTGD